MRTLWRVALWLPTGIAITDTLGCILRVEGDSMWPTLHGTGWSDLVLVEKVSYKWFHKYQRGDVAVFWYDPVEHADRGRMTAHCSHTGCLLAPCRMFAFRCVHTRSPRTALSQTHAYHSSRTRRRTAGLPTNRISSS